MSLHPSLQKLRTVLVQGGVRLQQVTVPAVVWTWAARLAWAGCLVLFLTLAAIQWVVFPRVSEEKPRIEQELSTLLGQPVRIGQLTPRWRGIHPGVVLDDLRLTDLAGHETLQLKQVAAFLAWRSVWRWQPTFDLLLIEAPVLHVRRDERGQVHVAGFLTEGETDPRVYDWLLAQRQLRVQHATVVWEDQRRKAPALMLNDVNFGLDNRGNTHRFGLTAKPPAALASRIDLRGEWAGGLHWQAAPTAAGGEEINWLDSLLGGQGRMFTEWASADLAAWRAWVDYPVDLPKGRGGIRVWASQTDQGREVTVDLGLNDVYVRLDPKLPALDIRRIEGRLMAGQRDAQQFVSAQKLSIALKDGLKLPALAFDANWAPRDEGLALNLNAAEIDLDRLRQFGSYLPLPQGLRSVLAEYAPVGRLKNVDSHWWVRDERLPAYHLKAVLENVGLSSVGAWPGVQHLSGQIDGSETGGELTVDSQRFELHWPAVFPDARQQFTRLQGRAGWKRAGQDWQLFLKQVTFANDEVTGQLAGEYDHRAEGAQRVDLKGQLQQGDARGVWRYLPGILSPETRHWLKAGLLGGKISEGEFALQGDLRQFPFQAGGDGVFRVSAKVMDGKLHYADGWPDISAIRGKLTFDRAAMRIEVKEGQTEGTQLGPVTVELADLASDVEPLKIVGEAKGDAGQFLKFIEHTPVNAWINHATQGMQATGAARLQLALDLPLSNLNAAQVNGTVELDRSRVQPLAFLPPVEGVTGRLQFTEKALQIPGLHGQWLGAPVQVKGGDGPTGLHVVANGQLNARALATAWADRGSLQPYLAGLSGQTEWRAEIDLPLKPPAGTGPGLRWRVHSDLLGLASSLPGPLNKSASKRVPLTFSAQPLPQARAVRGRPAPVVREQWQIKAEQLVNAQWFFRQTPHDWVFERGWLATGPVTPKVPERGLLLAVKWPELRAEEWLGFLTAESATGNSFLPPPSRLMVETDRVTVFGRAFERLVVQGNEREGDWQFNLDSPHVAGAVRWRSAGKGTLQADLKRLRLQSETGQPGSTGSVAERFPDAQSLPSFDIRVADLTLGNSTLGQLELKADNTAGVWNMPLVRISNPDATLSGSATWQMGSTDVRRPVPEKTDLDFQLNTEDAGRLLDRLGYRGMVKHGAGRLSGHLSWPGRPSRFDSTALSGQLSLRVKDGQFAKIEPGAGKLLGLLSLQNLPRRLLLDFKDVFTDGFAFDRIEGDTTLQSGVMRTQDPLEIQGPSALVLMQGDVNLRDETQQLMLTIRPSLSGVASLGAAVVVNPVVGLTALLAQKLLQNPLDKVFSFQYKVTGGWADPQVNKVE